ncbi:MAG: ABC transporter permease [Alphaproteobacteria bacterium]
MTRGASRWRGVARSLFSRPSGAIGATLVLAHVALAVASPWIVPYDFKAISAAMILDAPSAAHWLGTDQLGRDVLTRTAMGGRQAIVVTAIATPLAVAWGGILGIWLGLAGGRLDDVLMRVVEAFLSLRWILKMLLIIVTFGAGIGVLVPTLAFFYGIPVIRIARAATHGVVARDYVLAARARGHGRPASILREILPNVLDALMVEGAMRWSWMLLAFSSLSFLGFGVSPPTPDWGLMIADARSFMAIAPWAGLAPVVALSSLIVGINLAADALAKALGVDRAAAPVH